MYIEHDGGMEPSIEESFSDRTLTTKQEAASPVDLDFERPERLRTAWQCPDDGDTHPHLIAHLAQLGHLEAIETVLTAEIPDGKNGWFEARQALGQVAGYVEDLDRWWSLLRAEDGTPSSAISPSRRWGQAVRCALMSASLNAFRTDLPPQLLQNLVRFCGWKPAPALEYLGRMEECYDKTDAIVALAPHLPFELWPRLLESLRNVETPWVWSDLAPGIPPTVMPLALERAHHIPVEWARSKALGRLLLHLPASEWPLALKIARRLTERKDRAIALAKLAPWLPETERLWALRQALRDVRSLEGGTKWAETLEEVAPSLTPDLVQKALRRLERLPEEKATMGLGILARTLPQNLIPQALELAQSFEDTAGRAGALANFAAHLPPHLLQQALEGTQHVSYGFNRIQILIKLLPFLPLEQRPRVLRQALKTARGSGDILGRSMALSALAPHLPLPLLRQALTTVQKMQHAWFRSETLLSLAPYFPVKQQPEILQQALESAQQIDDPGRRASYLVKVAPHLPEQQRPLALSQALESALREEQMERWTGNLDARTPDLLAAQFPALIRQALERTLQIEEPRFRYKVQIALAPYLPREERCRGIQQARESLQHIGDTAIASEALLELAPHLSPRHWPPLLARLAQLPTEELQAQRLAQLTPYLPTSLLEQALQIAQNLETEVNQALALPKLAPHLPPTLLQQALESAQRLRHRKLRITTLLEVTAYLPPEKRSPILRQLLEEAQRIANRPAKAEAFVEIAPHLAPEQLSEILQFAPELEEADRSHFLRELAPILPASLIPQALTIAQHIEQPETGMRAVAALTIRLPVEHRSPRLAALLESISALVSDRLRAELLVQLAPHLPPSLWQQAFEVTENFGEDTARTRALIGMTPYLPIDLLEWVVKRSPWIDEAQARYASLQALASPLVSTSQESASSQPLSLSLGRLQRNLAEVQMIADPGERAKALTELAPDLSSEQQTEALHMALKSLETVENQAVRRKLLTAIAIQIRGDQIALCWNMLASLACETRETMLRILPHLATALKERGGVETIEEIVQAIVDVTQWWP